MYRIEELDFQYYIYAPNNIWLLVTDDRHSAELIINDLNLKYINIPKYRVFKEYLY